MFDPHRYLLNKSPIHLAVEGGKGNTFLNGKWHVQNSDLCPTTVKILIHLSSRYQLPLSEIPRNHAGLRESKVTSELNSDFRGITKSTSVNTQELCTFLKSELRIC